MKFSAIATLATVLVSGSLCAQTIKLNDAKDWVPNANITAKDGVITTQGRVFMQAKNMLTVDPAKSYSFSLQTKTAGDAKVWNLFGVRCYDAKGREISTATNSVFSGTDTELVAELKNGDKKLVVKDAAKWPARGSYFFVTGAKANYADIPNFNYEYVRIVKKEKKGASWEITLAAPIKKLVGKTGEKVRLHRGGGYHYVGGSSDKIGKTIVTLSGSAKGFCKPGVIYFHAWPTGTVKIRPIILSNWRNAKQAVEYKNITITIK